MKLVTVKEFLEEHQNVTVLGFAWSCYWRLMLTIYGIAFGIGVLLSLFGALAD